MTGTAFSSSLTREICFSVRLGADPASLDLGRTRTGFLVVHGVTAI
jgi:hypothetical protein